jgi:hypothetical protein
MYEPEENAPATVGEPVATYRNTVAGTSLTNSEWNPNVPFCGTQEEWWEHFHSIEEGKFTSWEEHQKKFNTWKKEYLANRMT